MNLDAHVGYRRQGAAGQQPLIEQRGRSLYYVWVKALGDAERIVAGQGHDANLFEQALLFQVEQLVPQIRSAAAEQFASVLDDDGFSPGDTQAGQRGASLGFHMFGALVGAGGTDQQAIAVQVGRGTDDGFAGIERNGGVQDRHAAAGADGDDLGDLGLGGARARMRCGALKAELRRAKGKLGDVRDHLRFFPPHQF